ncbi:TonB-dependent receptor [Aquimarina pacifica]|uniref:TonB-dependent receptor n=1 Tax=Aquimarina pacifica TaxID=1296415 RepID=UPI00055792AA|nr:TonB-dependent receptor [Aquimarina pacifica]
MKNKLLFLLCIINFSLSAQFNIKGIVRNVHTNTPLENVSIKNIDSNTVTYTSTDGTFSILTNGIIEVSKIGYVDKRIKITTENDLNIFLFPVTTVLDSILINQFSIPEYQKNTTDAVSLITANDIAKGNTVELQTLLNQVPGVFMQNGTLNTNKISIRGIGARNLFGTANIGAYFGDIPLTDGNGESVIEDLELGALSQIEIHKGPSASSYGVGLGGTILFEPNYAKTTQGELYSTLGSYGLQKNLIKASFAGKKLNIATVYSNTHSEGYRNNNQYDRNTLTITSQVDLGAKDELSMIGSYVHLNAGIPSSLNQEDFDTNPRQAAFTWGQAQGHEHVNYGILGITHKHTYSKKLQHHTSIFTSYRNNKEPRPFNILNENTNSIGIRSRILGTHILAKKEIKWTAGGMLFFDHYTSRTYENLYQNFPDGTGSVAGDQLSDIAEKRYYYNLFAEGNLMLNKKLKINAGMHLNQTFFDITDMFLFDGNDSSGQFDFSPILSPKIGANYTINKQYSLFANISHGFSTPTASETLLPEGVFNPAIKPEIGWNFEIGTRYNLLNNKLYGSLSIYTLRVKDLLVSRRTIDDNFFAINAGKTIHNGIEFETTYQILKSNLASLNLFFNTSIYDYTFDNFVDLDSNFSGNDLTGVPAQVTNIGIDFSSQKSIYGHLNFTAVGEMPADDANTVYSKSYELLHGKIGYKNSIGKHIRYDFFLGVNNILDTKYASQLQINAPSFGGNAPRYFYPGVPINIYGGANITYRL